MWHTSSTFSYFANSCLFNLSQISQGANIGNERFRFFPPGQKQYETVRTEKGVGALERSRKQEEIRRAFLLFSCGAEWSCGLLECSQECSFGVCYDCYEILSFGFRMFPAPTRAAGRLKLYSSWFPMRWKTSAGASFQASRTLAPNCTADVLICFHWIRKG